MKAKLRLCVACRKLTESNELIRLTYDFASAKLEVNSSSSIATEAGEKTGQKLSGRSAYLCRSSQCLEMALKNTKLKHALEGRRKKGVASWRKVAWPLEAQLIQALWRECTDPVKTCQNTQRHGEG